MDLLKGLVDRLESVTLKLESMASGKPNTESTSSADGESRAVSEFTQLMDGPLADFVNKGSALDEPLPKAVI
jgi:hypothetical protein